MRARFIIEVETLDDEDLPDLGRSILMTLEDADWESVERWQITGIQKEAGWINVKHDDVNGHAPKAASKKATRR